MLRARAAGEALWGAYRSHEAKTASLRAAYESRGVVGIGSTVG